MIKTTRICAGEYVVRESTDIRPSRQVRVCKVYYPNDASEQGPDVPQLDDDAEALSFIREHNPLEYQLIMGYREARTMRTKINPLMRMHTRRLRRELVASDMWRVWLGERLLGCVARTLDGRWCAARASRDSVSGLASRQLAEQELLSTA